MRFENPLFFLLVVPVIGATVWALFLADRRQASLAYPDSARLGLASRARELWVRHAPVALRSAALLLAVAALARPQAVSREFAGPAQGIDILLVLDTSTSMLAIDFDPLDRMTAAKNAAREFIRARVSDRIGILVFGGAPVLTCPLTLDYEALGEFIEGIEPGMTMTQGTAIGDALASGVGHLKDASAKTKVIILLTDGASNVDTVDPFTAAKTAKSFGIKVYTIGTGQRGTARVPVDDPMLGRVYREIPDELNEDALLKVAAETDGKYYRATNLRELSEIYAEIDRQEKTEFDRPEVVSFKDLHAWLLAPAAGLLVLQMLLSGTLLLRIP